MPNLEGALRDGLSPVFRLCGRTIVVEEAPKPDPVMDAVAYLLLAAVAVGMSPFWFMAWACDRVAKTIARALSKE
jgi:hypothetical protein